MATEVKFPSVGESITEGVLGVWHFADGDWVNKGDVIAEIETDKITSEIYADVSGKLGQAVAEGDTIQVGQVIGSIDDSAPKPAAVKEAEEAKKQADANSTAAGEEKAAPPQKWAQAPEPEAPAQPRDKYSKEPAAHAALLDHLSPAVRTLVADHGLDASAISGSGKGGRLLKSDILNAIEQRKRQPGPVYPQPSSPQTTRKTMTPLRRRIAERLVAAQNDAALLTTFNECDMSNVMNLRKQVQDRFVEKHGTKLGFMSFFVKAAIEALKAVPQVNAQIDDTTIVQNHYYDIGVAISTERGLMVPVLRGPDQMNLAEIETAIIDYAKKARAGKIGLHDLEGGVFTITNGGTFGSMLSTPLLNPPQSAILGIHNIVERPVAINGRVEVRPIMYLALSYDHRLIDGKEAVTFLVRVKEFIENPAIGLLDL